MVVRRTCTNHLKGNVMNNKQIYVNLPVKNLEKAKAFYAALGYSFNPKFTNEQGAGMIVSEPGRDETRIEVTIEFILESIRVEIGEHRLERRADPGQHGELMSTQVAERIFERVYRRHVSGVALHEQVVQRILDIG